MKIILVMVSTVDGKITKGFDSDLYIWTSKEDQSFFFSLLNRHKLMVMGSRTYLSAKSRMKFNKNRLRIVLSKNPEKFKNDQIAGKLEFINETPVVLKERLEKLGYKKMLLVGGGVINSLFLKANLVDELYLTVEPRIFGSGKNLVSENPMDINLKLKSVKRLNKKGTILLKYIKA